MTRADDLLERIAGITRRDSEPRMYRCPVCMDVGFVELPEGTRYESEGGNKAVAKSGGPGAVKRCKGPRDNGCPHEAWKREEAKKRAAQRKEDGRGDQAGL